MKVLSLLQPWASLVVMGHKRIETRSFNTKHRGPLLIHASMGKKREAIEAYNNFRFCGPLFRHEDFAGVAFSDLPFGAIIGSVNLAGTSILQVEGKELPTGYVSADTGESWPLTEAEKVFGHYAPKRRGWLLKDAIEFANPIPCKGDLGVRDILRKSAFAIVEERGAYYLTYYGQKVCGWGRKDEADQIMSAILDYWNHHKGDRSYMAVGNPYWPRILEIEQQLFNPGVAE